MQSVKLIIWILISGCFICLSACSGEQKSSTADFASGSVQLALTGSVDTTPTETVAPGPTDTADPGTTAVTNPDPTTAMSLDPTAIVISIKEIRAVPAGEEEAGEGGLPLIVAYDTPKVVNILDLAFLQELLGEAVLPAGTYTQVRLILEANTDPLSPANYIILAADPERKIPLNTPSGQESGLKIVGGFAVEAGETNTLVLDFDPARALVQAAQSGSWQLKPTEIGKLGDRMYFPTSGGGEKRTLLNSGST